MLTAVRLRPRAHDDIKYQQHDTDIGSDRPASGTAEVETWAQRLSGAHLRGGCRPGIRKLRIAFSVAWSVAWSVANRSIRNCRSRTRARCRWLQLGFYFPVRRRRPDRDQPRVCSMEDKPATQLTDWTHLDVTRSVL